MILRQGRKVLVAEKKIDGDRGLNQPQLGKEKDVIKESAANTRKSPINLFVSGHSRVVYR